MRQTIILILILVSPGAIAAMTKRVQQLRIAETTVELAIYEDGEGLTLFAPHASEQAAVNIGKQFIAAKGGRLIEISNGTSRNIRFTAGGQVFSVDPNRIFTGNGRTCSAPVGTAEAVRTFAESLLAELAVNGKFPPIIVALHNNTDADQKTGMAKDADLTHRSFVKELGGRYSGQAAGVFWSNEEPDADNFIYLAQPKHLSFFAAKGFSVVVQRADLTSKNCSIDDGSLSVFAGRNGLEYICLEADPGSQVRQQNMLEAVRELYQLAAADH